MAVICEKGDGGMCEPVGSYFIIPHIYGKVAYILQKSYRKVAYLYCKKSC